MKNLCFLKSFLKVFVIAFVSIALISCSGNKESKVKNSVLKVGQGYLSVPGGNIWYTVSGSGKGIPLALIHGGPGSSSFYLKPFEELGNDRQIIRYDQLGGGKSDAVTDTALFNIKHFVLELDSLRGSLGIKKRVLNKLYFPIQHI